ncbi:tyrosine-type recombinase/integrase [Nocardia sp. GAS34]|uniref:tyrosine-type recombinase/integrase n=1 Tax=unclassified Nocardia TaxID=2637762 RepID=UPI003D1A2D67
MPGNAVGTSARMQGPTTSRVRRTDPVYVKDNSFHPTAITPAPPAPPAVRPQPLGDLRRAPAAEIVGLATSLFTTDSGARRRNDTDMGALLAALKRFPGVTWQQRWAAAGLGVPGAKTTTVLLDDDAGQDRIYGFNSATGKLFAMRVIMPELRVFRSYKFSLYTRWFSLVHSDPLLHRYFAQVENLPASESPRASARFDVCCALTVFGIDLADLPPQALLHYAVESRKYGLTRGARPSDGSFAGVQAWSVLHQMGVFPASAPATLRAAVVKGQRSIAEQVDRHQLRNTAVRDLLVDYLTRRTAELDYSTSSHLVDRLARLFWKQIEIINPGQTDLRLDEQTFTAWKQWFLTKSDGSARLDIDGPLLTIRSFYLDLQSWAITEPERWAHWAAPCPIRDADLRWFQVRRRRIQERMAERTRQRQPLLPILSSFVNDRWHEHSTLLEAARAVGFGECFTLDGVTYQRSSSKSDLSYRNPDHAPVRVINRDTGELIRVGHNENLAFWQWAVIETLRLAGLRVEELTELTHLSVRNYQRPSGEVVALLVVCPSKSDRERVIPMSAELFHVIAQVIKRHIAEHGTVPVVPRYDNHERVWTPPMPYLFQTVHSAALRGMSTHTVWRSIRRAVEALALTRPEFKGVTFAPHDFRRAMATELVNNGLPIHIGAALLGHVNIQTTRGYVAVFDDTVIAHYQQFIERRRAQRPAEEYRKPTEDEWSEFQEHFDKRRVELGSCGRPYGTGCAHEFACVRCPMLSVDPKMLTRLDELEEDLIARRSRANEEGWRGEVEGLDLTLNFLRAKRSQTHRALRTGAPGHAELGMPPVKVKGPPPAERRPRTQ